jgi:hypothetical protein
LASDADLGAFPEVIEERHEDFRWLAEQAAQETALSSSMKRAGGPVPGSGNDVK